MCYLVSMKKVVTHDKGFHSDDVFAVAVLQLVYGSENLEIIRTRDEELIREADIVVDVGGEYDPDAGRFDHHQKDAPQRENGVPYAAIGLVWKTYGETLTTAYAAARIDERIVRSLDAGDNGITTYTVTEHNIPPVSIQAVVSSYLPVAEKTEETYYQGFVQAVDFARAYLKRLIAYYEHDETEYDRAIGLYQAAENKQIIISDEYFAYSHLTQFREPQLAIFPKGETDWRVYTITVDGMSFDARVSFPASWRGLRDEELESVSGITGAKFCHRSGFLFVCDSKEGAIDAAQRAK